MKLLQAKLARYDAPQKAKALGVYPYFREIESDQDTEVIINGKKVLMCCNKKIWYWLCRIEISERNA